MVGPVPMAVSLAQLTRDSSAPLLSELDFQQKAIII